MVTGASTADLAVVLVDARNGLTEQSRRHAFLATLLQVPHLVLAVNKMDLVDYDQAVFEKIAAEFSAFAAKLHIGDLTFIPISALLGDNVVQRSANMPWYDGPSLLHHLEHVHIASDRNLIDVRFPVQYVIRPHQATDPGLHDYRGYAGEVAGGVIRPGDEVMHLPSGFTTKVRGVEVAGQPVDEAFPPMSVTLLLDDDVDISRGDMICRPNNKPAVTQDVEAMVCWMVGDKPLTPRSRLVVKHTTRTVKAIVRDLHYRIDVNTLHRDETATGAGAERGRPGHAAADPAHLHRPVQPQPADRRPDPHRRGDQRHRRRGHDHRRTVSGTGEVGPGQAAPAPGEVGPGEAAPESGHAVRRPGPLRRDPPGRRAAAGPGRHLAGRGGPDAQRRPEEVRQQHLAAARAPGRRHAAAPPHLVRRR